MPDRRPVSFVAGNIIMVSHKRGRARTKFLTALTELDVGLCVTFQYPRYNFHAVKSVLEVRRIKIEEVRLLSVQPLDPETIAMQPLLRRGTVLVAGYDYDKRATRRFYLESMEELQVMQEPTYGEHAEPPVLYSVTELATGTVITRGLRKHEADAYAKQWSKRHGLMATTIEHLSWPTDAQVLEQLQLAQQSLSARKSR